MRSPRVEASETAGEMRRSGDVCPSEGTAAMLRSRLTVRAGPLDGDDEPVLYLDFDGRTDAGL